MLQYPGGRIQLPARRQAIRMHDEYRMRRPVVVYILQIRPICTPARLPCCDISRTVFDTGDQAADDVACAGKYYGAGRSLSSCAMATAAPRVVRRAWMHFFEHLARPRKRIAPEDSGRRLRCFSRIRTMPETIRDHDRCIIQVLRHYPRG